MRRKKLLVIVGPTASGKSALAIKLAEKLNGEIVSADSRQIYKGLEIGSNHPSKRELKAVPHHLIGLMDPKKTFTVAEYQKKARKIIADIWKRGKLPILCGGTGFYIQSVVNGTVMPEVPPQETLRKELERKTTEELAEILKEKDATRWKTIDRKNKRRLIRAIEIAAVLGKVPKIKTDPLKAEVLAIGLNPDKKILEASIKKRSRVMMERGFINETKTLLKNGVKEEKIGELGFEYQNALKYIRGEIKSKRELADIISQATMKYAKRQMTWFKRDKKIRWFKNEEEAVKALQLIEAVKFQDSNSK